MEAALRIERVRQRQVQRCVIGRIADGRAVFRDGLVRSAGNPLQGNPQIVVRGEKIRLETGRRRKFADVTFTCCIFADLEVP